MAPFFVYPPGGGGSGGGTMSPSPQQSWYSVWSLAIRSGEQEYKLTTNSIAIRYRYLFIFLNFLDPPQSRTLGRSCPCYTSDYQVSPFILGWPI